MWECILPCCSIIIVTPHCELTPLFQHWVFAGTVICMHAAPGIALLLLLLWVRCCVYSCQLL